jgi:hypothetical protein
VSEVDERVTGTVEMGEAYVLPTADAAVEQAGQSAVVRTILDLLRRACRAAPTRISFEKSASSETSTWRQFPWSESPHREPGKPFHEMPTICARMVLAYFGCTLMRSQIYGGYMRRLVEVDGRLYWMAFFMSNEWLGGYWLEVHILPAPPRALAPRA